MKRTTREKKIDEIGQEVVTSEGHEHTMVWEIENEQCQKVANGMAFVLAYFKDANRMMVKNMSEEVDHLTQ